ncbi:MAG: DUF411 domain-containing protein [Halofilum sp. (in: g-proteobacteria)]
MIRTALLLLAASLSSGVLAAGSGELYRDPNCGCCEAHAEYLRDHGLKIEIIAADDLGAVKSEQGVPRPLASCHTMVIDGYVVEGHVPIDSIRRLLSEQPDVAGIAVPGMPIGSPGMGEGLREPLQVWTIPAQAAQAPSIYATYQQL